MKKREEQLYGVRKISGLNNFGSGGDCNFPVLPVSNLSQWYYPVILEVATTDLSQPHIVLVVAQPGHGR